MNKSRRQLTSNKVKSKWPFQFYHTYIYRLFYCN